MGRFLTLLLTLVGLLVLAGCGTSGTPSGQVGSDPPGDGVRGGRAEEALAPVRSSDPLWESRRLPLLLSATGKAPGIERLWATIHKVELLGGQGDEAIATLQDDAGIGVELCGLGDRLLPLGMPPVKIAKPLARVRLTLGAALVRFSVGATSGEQVQLPEGLPRDSAGRPQLTLLLEKTLTPGTEPLTLSADLSKLSATGERTPLALSVVEGAKGEGTPREWTGIVRGVQGEAPTQRLLLGTELIALAPATVLLSDGVVSPKLAEGQRVRVRATLDPGTKALTALQVTPAGDAVASVRGKVVSIEPDAGTLMLSLDEASGVVPGQRNLTVSLAERPVLHRQGGLVLTGEELWRTLVSGATLQLSGIYEPVSGSLAASRVLVESAGPSLVTLSGPVSGGDEGSLTLGAPTAWDGFAPPAKGLPLALRPTTQLLGDDGAALKPDAFLAQAKERGVRVLGLLGKDGKVAASRLELLPRPVATPAPKPVPQPEKDALAERS